MNLQALQNDQQRAVKLTREGKYLEASLLHEKVDKEAPEGDLKYANRRDWCDALRRLPGSVNLTMAMNLVNSSIQYFEQVNDPEWAASMHHRARLHRQLGLTANALADIDQAASIFCSYNRNQRILHNPIHYDELYTELDRAAILAIEGHPKEAKKAARRALELVDEIGESKAHRTRAKLLYWFARWPRLPFKPVRYAFWGKTP